MLTLEDLTFSRGQQTWTHSFQVAPGRCLAVAGPSGRGKSTLLEAIAGFVPIRSGTLRWQDASLPDLTPDRRPVSTLFQDNNLFEHLSVEKNLRLGFRKGRPTNDQWQSVLAACHTLGIQSLLPRLPGALSGGQRQRVALIRAVLRPEPIVLLDEPFSALDDDNRQIAGDWVRERIRSASQAALFVSHNREDAERWADDVLNV